MKILIIEDEPEIIDSLNMVLDFRLPDVTVLAARTGGKGIDLVKNESPDLVILDLGLPDIHGFQVLRQIREFSTIPVMILTVQEDEVNRNIGFKLGADDYIVKPFSPGNLIARIRAVSRKADNAVVTGSISG